MAAAATAQQLPMAAATAQQLPMAAAAAIAQQLKADPSLSIEEYECALCLRLLCEPCTLRCGHSFCVRCCRDLAQARHANCPTCRRVLPVHSSATDLASSLSLSKLLAAVFSDEYAARQAEDASEAQAEEDAPAASVGDGAGESEDEMPIFYLDCMLPRQRLQLNIFEPRYRLMVRRCLDGSRRFGMMGVEWNSPLRHMGSTGMRYGVEVEIVENSPQADGRFHIEVVARRCFEIVGGTWEQDGYAVGKVRWAQLPSAAAAAAVAAAAAGVASPAAVREHPAAAEEAAPEPDAETATGGSGADDESAVPEGASTGVDSDAEALAMAAALEPLVEEWKTMVGTGGWERFRGQLGRLLADLGPMPAATDLDGVVERSLWVGALINPLPSLGVSMEVRPQLLVCGERPREMVEIATGGIQGSIAHMTPSPTVVWLRRQLGRVFARAAGRGAQGATGEAVAAANEARWLWRFLAVFGGGFILLLVVGTFVLVLMGVYRGTTTLLEAQHVADAIANGEAVDLTRFTNRAPPPPAPVLSHSDEL